MEIKKFSDEAYLNLSKILKSINALDKQEIIYSLRELAEILFELLRNNICDINSYKIIFKFFMNKTLNTLKDHKENKIEDLNKLCDLLNEKIGKNDTFPKLIYFLLINEYSHLNNQTMKSEILIKILSQNEVLKLTHLDIILDGFFSTNNILNNFKKLDTNEKIFAILSGNDNKILEEILFYYFENNINSCFENFNNENLFSVEKEPFEGFKKALNIFCEIYKDKNII